MFNIFKRIKVGDYVRVCGYTPLGSPENEPRIAIVREIRGSHRRLFRTDNYGIFFTKVPGYIFYYSKNELKLCNFSKLEKTLLNIK